MASQPIRVLLVEDNPGDARLIHWMLGQTGEVCFELAEADRLSAALGRLRAEPFSVVLLDLSLPDSQGLETFRAVSADFPRVPVVVLTGLADETAAVQAVQEGAQDYLVKGQVLDRHLVHALHYAVGRHQRQQCRDREGSTSAEEVRVARQIQQHLFPQRPPACAGIDLHGASFPAGATGGDYFDYLPLDGGRVGVVIGDVTGHGLGPALLMMATRAYLRAFAQSHADIGQVLARTNRVLAEDVTEGRFVTLLLAQLDEARHVLRYASAGHCPGYVLGPTGAVRTPLYSTGLPLGILPDGDFPVAPEVRLEPGEVVVLWTDGILEAQAPDGEQFGEARALGVVRSHRGEPAREIVEALCRGVHSFTQAQPPHDDMTAIVLKVQGPAESTSPLTCAAGGQAAGRGSSAGGGAGW
jgi:serine phosphatase RsbU (regulator of sigma subunit)